MKRIAAVLLLFAACATPDPERTLLPAEPNVPFPEIVPVEVALPEPKRIIHATSPETLQETLCRLEPGDRLVLAPDVAYPGPLRIADACRNGTPDAPIQVFAHDAWLAPGEAGDVLTVEREHWQFRHPQISLRESSAGGMVIRANHVTIDHAHIFEGNGAAIRIDGAQDVAITNGHIHHSGGVRVAGERIALRGNHLHHNRAASIAVDSAKNVSIEGNRIHNDRGPAIDVQNGTAIAIKSNRIWNGRPVGIALREGAREVTIERNAIVEATIGVSVRGAEQVRGKCNFYENRLTRGGKLLDAASGREIHFDDQSVVQSVERCAEP